MDNGRPRRLLAQKVHHPRLAQFVELTIGVFDAALWMPPFAQDVFERPGPRDRVRSCIRPVMQPFDMAAGWYGDARIRRKSKPRAVELAATRCVPNPDLTDHVTLQFVDLLTRPTLPLVAIALANKMARMIWAMLTKGASYRAGVGGSGMI
jgi:hypothetical protein